MLLRLMQKTIDLNQSPLLAEYSFSPTRLELDWQVRSGEWRVEGDWLTGKNPGNCPGVILSRRKFPGNVLLEFEGRTVLPSSHDIDFMWNCSWDESRNQRGAAYVAGLEGWWEGKAGIEKSPDYQLTACTPLFDFQPGQTCRILGGSVEGHCFLFVNDRLILELTDPAPVDYQLHSLIGFEAYCSHIQVRNLKVRQVVWQNVEMLYPPEF